MARPGETITIPIAKAFAAWEQNQELFGKKFEPRGDLGAILIWAMPYNLIDGDEIEITDYEDINKAAIKTKSRPGTCGNALVALTMSGEIRWSWHLWITDYNPGADMRFEDLATGPNDVDGGKVYRYRNETDIRDHVFMDRNLGANSADKTGGKETHGMYYQWGKKDTLPGFAPVNYVPQGLLDDPPQYRENNLAYSIENPDEFIVPGSRSFFGWYSYHEDTFNDDLWGGLSEKKTIYDPCPEGWRVPFITFTPFLVSKDMEYITHVPWEPLDQFERVNPTGNHDVESPVLGFYPAAGSIRETGELREPQAMNYMYIWTATTYPREWGISPTMALSINFLLQKTKLEHLSEALNIRCERYFKEEKDKTEYFTAYHLNK